MTAARNPRDGKSVRHDAGASDRPIASETRPVPKSIFRRCSTRQRAPARGLNSTPRQSGSISIGGGGH